MTKFKPPGQKSEADLATLYRHADFLVVRSLMEGFCLPVLEGQGFGVPVVCSDIPVLREVAGKGARFFDPRDSSDMASAIRDVSQAHVGNGAVRFMLRMLKGVDDVLLGAFPGLGRYCGECVAVYWK